MEFIFIFILMCLVSVQGKEHLWLIAIAAVLIWKGFCQLISDSWFFYGCFLKSFLSVAFLASRWVSGRLFSPANLLSLEFSVDVYSLLTAESRLIPR